MDLQGKTIGEYQLIELIHQGQNTIYKGFRRSTNRYVYVETGSLEDRLPTALSPQGAQRMINPVAEAMDYLHGQGVVSGNVEPSNILITEQGQPARTAGRC